MTQNNYQGALQQPLHSGFTSQSSSIDVMHGVNLSGVIAIVTGGNTGIGLETTRSLCQAGATVIVPARNTDKAKKNLSGLANVEIEYMDMMNPLTIDEFAAKFISTNRPLHLLINNAGIMWVPLRKDQRGLESQLATNFIGQFHLTARLWPALKKAAGARVINVSSLGHHLSPFDFEDPNFENRPYETLTAYGQSKTASNLFTAALDEKAADHGVRSYAVHPGSIAGTELGREASPELFRQMGFTNEKGEILPEVLATLKSVPQGAATTLWAATSPLLANIGGVYCEDAEVAELLTDHPQSKASLHKSGVQPYSLDQSSAHRLWDFSEKATGIRFGVE